MMDEEISREKKENELKIFNEAVEYYEDFSTEESIKSTKAFNSIILREQMLSELNNLKELILNNPDSKISQLSAEERESFNDFIKAYSICPICGGHNHYYNLKQVYFNEEVSDLKEYLIENMNSKEKKIGSLTVITGIPCCSCFKKYLKS
jgi:hypothetical protein